MSMSSTRGACVEQGAGSSDGVLFALVWASLKERGRSFRPRQYEIVQGVEFRGLT